MASTIPAYQQMRFAVHCYHMPGDRAFTIEKRSGIGLLGALLMAGRMINTHAGTDYFVDVVAESDWQQYQQEDYGYDEPFLTARFTYDSEYDRWVVAKFPSL